MEVLSDPFTMADDAVARLQATWKDYTPNDADLEVVIIESVAPMAQNAAETTARVPPAVFRTVGQMLHGIAYNPGSRAVGTVTFTLVDTAAHTIRAGTEIDVDGWAFTVDNDTPTAALTVAGVPVTAVETGTGGNLPGTAVTMITALAFVANVDLDGTTAGGTEAETDVAYQDRLSRELELTATTLVTAHDYELMGLSEPGIGRVNVVSDPVLRTVLVTVADASGLVVPVAVRTRLSERYAGYRLSNWTVTVGSATYTAVSVTYTVHPYPGYNAADLLARIDAQLTTWLSPETWGQPKQFPEAGWVASNVVRKNKLIDLIGDVDGVDYVGTLTITGGTASGDDRILAGTVALPIPGTFTGSTV